MRSRCPTCKQQKLTARQLLLTLDTATRTALARRADATGVSRHRAALTVLREGLGTAGTYGTPVGSDDD